MGLTPEVPAGADERLAAASAFGRSWAARLLGSGPLTDDERSTVARAIARCYAHAALVPPTAVRWVATPEQAEAFLDGDDDVVLSRTEVGPDPEAPRWTPPWAQWLAGARPAVRTVGWVLSPLAGMFLGTLLVGLALMLWLGLVLWLAIAGAVFLLVLGLRAVAAKFRSKASLLAAVFGVLALWGVFFVAALVAVARPENLLPVPDPLGQWAVLVGAVGGGLGLPLLGLRSIRTRRRRRRRAVRRGVDPELVARRFDEVRRKALEAAGQVDNGVWTTLNRVVVDADPLARAGAGRLDGALARWAWAENRAGDKPQPASWFGPSRSRRRAALRAFESASRVHWRPAGREVVAVEPPLEVHGGPDGLHRLDGPAVRWADGSEWYALHGVRLPRAPDAGDWTAEEINSIRSSEARRVMIETIGWDAYLEQAAFTLCAEAPDPGNPPHRLELYSLPEWPFGRLRLLVMTNGSPSRDGRQRRYAEFVPRRFSDPVEAAAWQYGVPVEVYRQLQRRT